MAKRLSWAVRLARAKERGKFTIQDWRLAEHWNTCAIGERHGFPRTENEAIDLQGADALRDQSVSLGCAFAGYVVGDDIPEAERIYALIQALPPVEVIA